MWAFTVIERCSPYCPFNDEDVKNIVKYIHLFHGNISFLYFCHTKICKS